MNGSKKIVFSIIILLISCFFVYLSYLSIIDMNKPSEETNIKGKDISKEEYIYKEKLLELGYTIDEIKIIENKISNINVKNYLLNIKYNNLTKFVYSPYFKAENIERYENYYIKNPNYSFDEIVLYVEIGLDIEFYTNIKEITNYNDVTALVNKYYKLPNDLSYNDLVTLEEPYSNDGKKQLRKVAYDAMVKMINAAKEDNINLYVISGFRTYEKQKSLFDNSESKNGLEHALLYSAKPGHSEHQLGLAADLITTQESFDKTKEYAWLKENAYKYGFIERYPKDKEFITGYGYEPWHYRYLGIEIATKIYTENITYEEYVVKYEK